VEKNETTEGGVGKRRTPSQASQGAWGILAGERGLRRHRKKLIDQQQNDKKNQTDTQAPSDQLLLDWQQGLSRSTAEFVVKIRFRHCILLR
jgi:hypothetical protein